MKKPWISLCVMLALSSVLNADGSSNTRSHSVRITIQYPNFLSLKKSEIQWETDQSQKIITIGSVNESDKKIPQLQIKKCIKGVYSQHAVPDYSNIKLITICTSSGNCKYDISVINKPDRDVKDCTVIFTITDGQ